MWPDLPHLLRYTLKEIAAEEYFAFFRVAAKARNETYVGGKGSKPQEDKIFKIVLHLDSSEDLVVYADRSFSSSSKAS